MQIPKLPMIHLGHHSVFSNVKFFCFSTDAWSLRDISHYIEKWELSCPADVLIPYLIYPGHSQYEHMHLQLCLLSFWYCQHLKQCIIACHLVNLPFLTCWYLYVTNHPSHSSPPAPPCPHPVLTLSCALSAALDGGSHYWSQQIESLNRTV